LCVEVALSDLDDAVFDADILVFVVPYQYIHDVCEKLRGRVKSSALAVSLVKVAISQHADVFFCVCLRLHLCHRHHHLFSRKIQKLKHENNIN